MREDLQIKQERQDHSDLIGRIETVEINQKQILRRLDSVEKNIDLILKKMDLLEDVELQVSEMKTALHMNREKQGEVRKELSADIKDVQNAVEDSVQEVKDIVGNKEILMIKPNAFDKVKKILGIKK
mgnify:CR=1 FL=1